LYSLMVYVTLLINKMDKITTGKIIMKERYTMQYLYDLNDPKNFI
jgi:ubiquinone biosynthesis protein Coq4